jgi:rod shape-determining protein MreC
MGFLEIRQRTGWLFVGVVVAHLVLISAQAKTGGGVSMLSSVVFGAFAEIQRGATGAVGGAQHAWQDYFALQQVRRQNETLQNEVATLRVQLQQEQNVASQSRSLQELLGLKQELANTTTGARVIGGSPSPEFRTITIDKGTQDGLQADMAVIAPAGVVGRILEPSARSSKVQLLIDNTAAAGAIVERTRAQGLVVGRGRDGLRLDYVSSSADIKVGDRVITSGVEGIYPVPRSSDAAYPKGFVIGQIESLDTRGRGQYENVVVKPAVDFSALETVLVVLEKPARVKAGKPGKDPAAGVSR